MTIPWPIALDNWDVWRFLIKAQITFNQEVSPGETHMTTSTWHNVIACSLLAHCQFKGVNQQCSTRKGFMQTFTKRKQMEKNEFELKYTLWQHYWHSSLILSVAQISDEIDGLPYYHLLYVDIKMLIACTFCLYMSSASGWVTEAYVGKLFQSSLISLLCLVPV